ncbi:MAG TPA: pyrroloquinoline quinone biosynthesis protein PqqB [Terriglobales bacterium]|nr:pyrroloquinoline quinone biosynthesis protein PqqB [Terriglobales bacterium]
MHIEILGSAAGGGFPQWNCACGNCASLRAGNFSGKARTQTQVAISGDNGSWFLLNASPDLRLQIESTAVLRPQQGTRSSPIAGVVLTSADLDQVVGLLSLRELQRFQIYCTPSLQTILRDDNSVFGMLNRIPEQVVWNDIEWLKSFSLTSIAGQDSGLRCEHFSLGSRYPVYVGPRTGLLAPQDALLGLIVTSSTGRRLAYLPAVPAIDAELMRRLEDVDLVLFDGTFWSDDELIRVQGSGATAREMGHVPVSADDGSLKKLSGLRRPRKVFIHVNNTNPMLNEASAEYGEVRAAGWEIAEDGWHLAL